MSDFGICLDTSFQENQESLTCDLPEQYPQKPADFCQLEPVATDQDYFVPSESDASEPQLSFTQFHKQIYQDGIRGISSMPSKSFGVGGLLAYSALPLSLAGCKGKSSEISPSGLDDAQPKTIHKQKKRVPKKVLVPKEMLQPCYDNSVIRREITLKVEGLEEPVSVYYSGDFSVSNDKFDAYVKKTFNYVAETIPAEAMNFALQGKQRNSIFPPFPAKIILMPNGSEVVKEIFLKCGNIILKGHVDGLGALTTLPDNRILVPFNQNKIKNLNFAKKFDPNESFFTETIIHELLHSLEYFLNSKMTKLKEHYDQKLREAFPNQRFERYKFLIKRLDEGKATKKESREYWKEFAPILEKYFLNTAAAKNFREYFAYNGTAYLLTSRKYYFNRKKLKSIDPKVHDMFKAFFEKGGVDTTPFEKPSSENE